MRLLRDQSGIALATALGVLTVVSILSASVFAVSTRLSDTSTASRDAKRALAAADAGIEAASFRMNNLGLQSTSKCFTTQAVATGTGSDPITGGAPATGECAGYREDLGNGAKYTYYVTPELKPGDVCAGLPVFYSDAEGKVTVTQRCVTSVGEVNGVRRRVQARVASYIGTQLFPVGGILAINGLTVNNTAIIGGVLGSNGQIQLGNSSTVSGGVELGTASTPPPILGSGTTLGGPVTYRSESQGAFVLAPPEFGNTATENDNARIISNPVKDTGSKVSYNATTRTLTLDNNGSLTLGGATYNFCKVTMGNNSYISIAPGARVRFFLDSPDRPGSGCVPSGMNATQARAAGYGGLVMGQGANFNNPGHAINFQIYMYGYNDLSNPHTVEFQNTAAINAAIYAPNSTLIWKNTAGITGGVSASKVEFKNSASFQWSGDSGGFSLQDLRTDTVSVYYRMAWRECQRNRTTTSDPESGC